MPKQLETSFVINGSVSQDFLSSVQGASDKFQALHDRISQIGDEKKLIQQFDLWSRKLRNTSQALADMVVGTKEWTRERAAVDKYSATYANLYNELLRAGISTKDLVNEQKRLNAEMQSTKVLAKGMEQSFAEEAFEVRKLAQEYANASQQLARMNAQEQARVNGTYQAWQGSSPQNINIPGADNINYSSTSVEGSLYNSYRQTKLQNDLAAIDKREAAEVEAWQKSFKAYWSGKNPAIEDNSYLLMPQNNSKFYSVLRGLGLGGITSAGLSGAAPYFLAGLAVKGAFDFGKSSLVESMGLEQVMSEVAAYTTASKADLSRLTNKAKEIGLNTVFSAQEAGKAMTYLGKAGWTTTEINAGIGGVMSLAAASGEDLSQTSSIVADALGAFGLSPAESKHFADVLAKTATRSNTDVGLIGETFRTSAPVAGALGFSIEDISQMIGILANVGIKGSRAGTTTRNILNSLASGFTISGAALGDYQYTATKANGQQKTLRETIDELREAFSKLTNVEKVNNAQNIASMRGYAGLLAIVNASEEEYAKLAEEIDNASGAADEMAKRRLDNLAGDLKLFKDAWAALKTEVGETLTPAARVVTQTGTTLITNAANNVKSDRGILTLNEVTNKLSRLNYDNPYLTDDTVYQSEALRAARNYIRDWGDPEFAIRNYLQHVISGGAPDYVLNNARKILEEYGWTDFENGYSMSEAHASHPSPTGIKSSLEELSDEYQNLLSAAEESITGQFELWEQASEVIPKDIYDILDAQESQAEYWKQYTKNLDDLYARAENIPGFTDFLKSNATGTKDAVALMAGLAEATDTEIAEMLRLMNATDTAELNASAATREGLQVTVNQTIYANGASESTVALLEDAGDEIALRVEDALRRIQEDRERLALA